MKFIPLTQNKIAIVDDDDFERLSVYNWHFHDSGKGYAKRIGHVRLGKRQYKYKSLLMHRVIMDAEDNQEVDHINRNSLDNRKSNLRICTRRENLLNRGLQSNNKSGHKCVIWYKPYKKWMVQVKVNSKNNFIGYYKEIDDAIKARDKFLTELPL